MKTQIDIILKQVTKGKIVFCPKNAPKQTKKPVTQAQMLDMIGFLKANYLTASLRALPALNAGTLEAAIVISLPVCGLRPLRAARSRTSKLPKPIN